MQAQYRDDDGDDEVGDDDNDDDGYPPMEQGSACSTVWSNERRCPNIQEIFFGGTTPRPNKASYQIT